MTDLFDYATLRARASDPVTSHIAASRAGSLAAEHCALIRRALRDAPGTIYDIAERTGLSHVQIARRLPEMERDGSARPTGETAPSPAGRPCRIWAL